MGASANADARFANAQQIRFPLIPMSPPPSQTSSPLPPRSLQQHSGCCITRWVSGQHRVGAHRCAPARLRVRQDNPAVSAAKLKTALLSVQVKQLVIVEPQGQVSHSAPMDSSSTAVGSPSSSARLRPQKHCQRTQLPQRSQCNFLHMLEHASSKMAMFRKSRRAPIDDGQHVRGPRIRLRDGKGDFLKGLPNVAASH